jgi:DNA modification methylase
MGRFHFRSSGPPMIPVMEFHNDGQARFLLGDARVCLKSMPAESVQMCVTSPPYWSLRDYGIEPGVWCGGWRGALGLEPTPEAYVEHIVEVFREVKRVLRKDATCWINIGDSYAGGRRGGNPTEESSTLLGGQSNQRASMSTRHMTVSRRRDDEPIPRSDHAIDGLKPKDLVGIPWMLAFALRADGWWLRQDIIWAKPNPMPESVTDRCTKAHEYLFLLSRSERYYYDADAIRETAVAPLLNGSEPAGAMRSSALATYGLTSATARTNPSVTHEAGRNKRDVWTIPTAPFPESHFATYPPALVTPCILAGSREGDTVLDPFLGSGTTAMVAKQLGRRAIGIDASAEYLEMAVRRCAQMGLV